MSDSKKQAYYGSDTKEDLHFFIFDKTDGNIIHIENIGYTPPDTRYCVNRTNNNYFVFEYVISGKGHLEIDGATYELNAGDVYCIEPGYDHVYYSDPDEPYEKVWINFFSDFFSNVFSALGISGKHVFKNVHCQHLFEEIRKLSLTSNYSADICHSVASVLFQISCLLSKSTKISPLSELAREIKRMLDNALYSDISIEEIADTLHVSKVQVVREFHKYFAGNTPYNYLLNNKIEIAKQLLTNTSLSVSEISDRLSFSDPHYFSRIFKKKTGFSPTYYKTAKKR